MDKTGYDRSGQGAGQRKTLRTRNWEQNGGQYKTRERTKDKYRTQNRRTAAQDLTAQGTRQWTRDRTNKQIVVKTRHAQIISKWKMGETLHQHHTFHLSPPDETWVALLHSQCKIKEKQINTTAVDLGEKQFGSENKSSKFKLILA